MALIFAVLTLALFAAFSSYRRLAVAVILCCLLLSIGQFLWEVYSPDYGFRMPWLQVRLMLERAGA